MGYFLDTYAIIEYLQGNEAYLPYFEEQDLHTSTLDIIELYYYLLAKKGEKKADELCVPFLAISQNPKPLTIKNAMKFRLEHKKKNLSYADCISYVMAKENGLKFLTGDKEFKGLANVEFVK